MQEEECIPTSDLQTPSVFIVPYRNVSSEHILPWTMFQGGLDFESGLDTPKGCHFSHIYPVVSNPFPENIN
jgi:hypothetical protein